MSEQKKPSLFFRKIPKTALLTPGGMICLVLAITIELFDYLLDGFCFLLFHGMSYEVFTGPIKAFIDFLYAVFSAFLLGIPAWSNLVPFLIERIPVLGTFLPSWILRLFL